MPSQKSKENLSDLASSFLTEKIMLQTGKKTNILSATIDRRYMEDYD